MKEFLKLISILCRGFDLKEIARHLPAYLLKGALGSELLRMSIALFNIMTWQYTDTWLSKWTSHSKYLNTFEYI